MATVLLGVSGSVACYKACTLASRLTQSGHRVPAVLTRHAAELVTARLFRAISGEEALVSEFEGRPPTPMPHISLADEADAFLVAPATASTIARLRLGLAEDLLATTALVLRADALKFLAPAMNPRMFAHPAVQENLSVLAERGWTILGPDAGWMACGDEGPGRLLDPEEIARVVHEALRGASA